MATKEMIKQQVSKVQAALKAEQAQATTMIEERIDEMLVQIQNVISGLEDTLYSKIKNIEEIQNDCQVEINRLS